MAMPISLSGVAVEFLVPHSLILGVEFVVLMQISERLVGTPVANVLLSCTVCREQTLPPVY